MNKVKYKIEKMIKLITFKNILTASNIGKMTFFRRNPEI